MKSGFYRAAEYYWSQVAIGMLVFAPVTVTVGFNIQAAMAGYRPGTEPHHHLQGRSSQQNRPFEKKL
jgi:hypothetical protein